jgi:hypothetical protein
LKKFSLKTFVQNHYFEKKKKLLDEDDLGMSSVGHLDQFKMEINWVDDPYQYKTSICRFCEDGKRKRKIF